VGCLSGGFRVASLIKPMVIDGALLKDLKNWKYSQDRNYCHEKIEKLIQQSHFFFNSRF
jgi:hypothetical protein